MVPASVHYDDSLLQIHLEQAAKIFPGADYYEVLGWIHRILRPRTYVEIGIRNGDSLRAALPETQCVGIDPEPTLSQPPAENMRIFRMTSDEFFQSHSFAELWDTPTFALAFIDGLHLFEQTLMDFINLERRAGHGSIILLHDCLPLDRVTSERMRTTHFYSGDVWKTVACLWRRRPDLTMEIIRTAPTGLCVVSNLDPHTDVLSSSYNAIVEEYLPLNFEDYRANGSDMPPMIENTFKAVQAYLSGLAQDSGSSGTPYP